MNNWLDSSNNANKMLSTYIQGFVDISGGNLIVRNGNLYVGQDASLNGNAWIQKKLTVVADSSLNGNLYVGQDASLNGNAWIQKKLTVVADSSLNGNLYVGQDASLNGNAWIQKKLTVVADSSLNGNLYVGQDASLNGNAWIQKKLTVVADSSLGGYLYVGQDASLNGNAWIQKKLTVGLDSSLNGNLYVGQDASFNGSVLIQKKLTVVADSSLNGNLYVGQDASFNGLVLIQKKLTVIADSSLNGNLYVGKDASFNGNVWITSTKSINGLYITQNSESSTNMNLGLGYQALKSIDPSGINNLAIGPNALTACSKGQRNIGIGLNALVKNTNSIYNIAIGVNSLANLVDNSSNSGLNIAIGDQSLYNLTGGSNNTAVGVLSLQNNSTGSNNVAIGAYASRTYDLAGATNNQNCTYIGTYTHNSPDATSYSNSTALGYNATITASNQIVLGTTSETVIVPNTLTSTKNITVNSLPIGRDASANLQIGSNALANCKTGNNFAIGDNALQNIGTGPSRNTAVGKGTLYSLSTTNGWGNTACGFYALSKANGSGNTAVGSIAGYVIANDYNSGASDVNYCTFIGAEAGTNSSSTSYLNSTALGYNATIDASNQIVLGKSIQSVKIPGTSQSLEFVLNAGAAAYNPTTKLNDIILLCKTSDTEAMALNICPWAGGASGLRLANDASNNFTATLNGKMEIIDKTSGTATLTSGSLIISHTTSGGESSIVFPSKVNINDFGYIRYMDDVSSNNLAGTGEHSRLIIGIENDANDPLYMDCIVLMTHGNGTVGNCSTTGGGTVLINKMNPTLNSGNTLPLYILDVNGTIGASGQITGQSFNALSDYRLKTNIGPLNSTFTIDNLKPVSYTFKDSNKMDIGFLAHEVQEQFPFLVSGNKDDTCMQSLNYNGFIGILVKELQDLKKELQESKKEIIELKSRLTIIESQI